ncbi:MAG: GFA family protein [Candidatus Binatia bacterium]
MSRARCLCGAVTWESDGPLQFMSHCHCARCRKAHGAAFATAVAGPADRFRFQGTEHVARWESSPGLFRCFCGRCGSVVPGNPFDGMVFLPAGNFDDDPGARPLAHIFVASKAPWFEIHDSLPRFDAYPPGIDASILPDRQPLDPPGGIRGSCLCGGVTYVLEGKLLRCANCHCSRCRKAYSAAHASDLVAVSEALRFTRGEEMRITYKVPETKYFTHVFCRACGSSTPRVDGGRGIAIVPMGTLDDDPGIRPQYHIFVGSKAPWYTIADGLPQYAEYPPS